MYSDIVSDQLLPVKIPSLLGNYLVTGSCLQVCTIHVWNENSCSPLNFADKNTNDRKTKIKYDTIKLIECYIILFLG